MTKTWWLSIVAVVLGATAVVVPRLAADDDDEPSDTLFGVSVRLDPTARTSAALDGVVETIGEPRVIRAFSDSLPPAWSTLEAQYGAIPLVISFKADPAAVVAGEHDDYLRAWFAAAPTDRETWWAYFHEPENEVEAGVFTAAEFRAAWRHIAVLAETADNDLLRATMVLMCWTVNPGSGRSLGDYATRDLGIEVLAWDCYNYGARQGDYLPPADLLEAARKSSAELGAGWGVAEFGSLLVPTDDGSDRAAWLAEAADYARRHEADFVTYFEATVGGDYRLSDPASAQVWAEEMATSPVG